MTTNTPALRILNKARYVLSIGAYVSFAYYVFMFHLVIPGVSEENYQGWWVAMTFFHVFFLLFLWSFYLTVVSDPGKVPSYWGFFLDDPEFKKKRYCLICHIFKPERCHHCSACNRCVLNMDHHCPWVQNCIGFANRKYFMLMLFYLNLVMLIMTIVMLGACSQIIESMIAGELSGILLSVFFVANIGLFGVLIYFFRFHFDLVLKNNTTIENMERTKKTPEGKEMEMAENKYDIDRYYNWTQVFGKRPVLWLVPLMGESGRPVGDGIIWKIKGSEDVEVTEQEKDTEVKPRKHKRKKSKKAEGESSAGNSGSGRW